MSRNKCTCRPGHFLCPEAERLWALVNAAYFRKDWDALEDARWEYDEHIEAVKR